ncbi:hypothetical protein G5V59_09775 [Nocardioides sp. W3-2-3]|uniref:hypothetical protein n=1 Tax=Nocardioides convexus TaxID=2712224 RepID=UPI002418233C|nr:hypothetical protein [Nocardioides convexus]NHA00297.1 hypothetical protein [Nocardioides convexus]
MTEPGGLVTSLHLRRARPDEDEDRGVVRSSDDHHLHLRRDSSRVSKTLLPASRDAITGTSHQQQVVQTYDVDGNVATTEVSDALGGDPARLTTYEYDDHNRMTSVTDPSGNQVSYEYDQFGNQTSMVDAKGTRTEFAYTARNKIAEVRLRDPDQNGAAGFLVTMAYAYDPAGRLVATYDAMGRKVTIDYFHDDLVAKKTLTTFKRPGETQETPYVLEQYTYDKAGGVVTEKTGNGTRQVTYTRDEQGRVKTQTVGVAPLTRKTTYTYDRLREREPGRHHGRQVERLLDDDRHLERVLRLRRRGPPDERDGDAAVGHGHHHHGLRRDPATSPRWSPRAATSPVPTPTTTRPPSPTTMRAIAPR